MPERLSCGRCKVPHVKKEAGPRWDKELSVHSEVRLLEVRPSWRDAGVTGRMAETKGMESSSSGSLGQNTSGHGARSELSRSRSVG